MFHVFLFSDYEHVDNDDAPQNQHIGVSNINSWGYPQLMVNAINMDDLGVPLAIRKPSHVQLICTQSAIMQQSAIFRGDKLLEMTGV